MNSTQKFFALFIICDPSPGAEPKRLYYQSIRSKHNQAMILFPFLSEISATKVQIHAKMFKSPGLIVSLLCHSQLTLFLANTAHLIKMSRAESRSVQKHSPNGLLDSVNAKCGRERKDMAWAHTLRVMSHACPIARGPGKYSRSGPLRQPQNTTWLANPTAAHLRPPIAKLLEVYQDSPNSCHHAAHSQT